MSVIMLGDVMLNVVNEPLILSVIMLGVVMLSVVVPQLVPCAIKHYEFITYGFRCGLVCFSKLVYM